MSGQTAEQKYNLTEGGIGKKLLFVALPIMATQLIQMAYNLTDMFWLGRINSDAVAASGTVGMYLWLSLAFMMYGRMGAEIGVAQNIGKGAPQKAQQYAHTSLLLAVALGVAFGAVMIVGRTQLIGFFHIQESNVVSDAEIYLAIVAIGIPFTFITSAVTGIFNGSGNARMPFIINGCGLVINMALDPLLIFHYEMGIAGAAWATIIAEIIAAVLSVAVLCRYKNRPFADFRLWRLPEKSCIRQILRWATPVAIENFVFTFLAMFTNRLVAAWGAGALAGQRISTQVESLSWLISGGFSSALTAFVGQNYGAGKWNRVHRGYKVSSCLMLIWGIVTALALFVLAEKIITIFLPNDPEVARLGTLNLRIIAACVLPCCLEGIAIGAYRGVGRTLPPSLTSVSANTLRVIAAYLCARQWFGTMTGLYGIWWAVSLGATVRSIWIYVWYWRAARKMPRIDDVSAASAQVIVS